MPYTYVIRWLVELTDPNTHIFKDASRSPLVSFKPEFIAGLYVLRIPEQLLTQEFLKKSIPKFKLDELIKYWMDEPTLYARRLDRKYLVV